MVDDESRCGACTICLDRIATHCCRATHNVTTNAGDAICHPCTERVTCCEDAIHVDAVAGTQEFYDGIEEGDIAHPVPSITWTRPLKGARGSAECGGIHNECIVIRTIEPVVRPDSRIVIRPPA